jgi:Plasmid pRiA4b ORF-3-like protein
MSERRYLIRISLMHIEPEIWRRIVVPGSITLDRLHDVIQIVMGWHDSHLHQFTIGIKNYSDDPEIKAVGQDEERFRLVDLLKQKGRKFKYLYDFSDCWFHEITIEDSDISVPEVAEPVFCLEGSRACPPEDVGSDAGYYEFCKVIADPDDPQYQSYMDWMTHFSSAPLNTDYDPDFFSPDQVNGELRKFLRWSRNRNQLWETR